MDSKDPSKDEQFEIKDEIISEETTTILPQTVLETTSLNTIAITDQPYTVEPIETDLKIIDTSALTSSNDTVISTPQLEIEKDTNLNDNIFSNPITTNLIDSTINLPSSPIESNKNTTLKKSTSPERQLTAPSWYSQTLPRNISTTSNSNLPSSSSSLPPSSPKKGSSPKQSLDKTFQDLRTLLKSFLIFIPSSLRKLKFLVPSPLIKLTRAIIRQMAIGLHNRNTLASSLFYDVLVAAWTAMITIFFREIRSRGAWKIPVDGEGAVIFVVGPHHNQVSPFLSIISYQQSSNLFICIS